MNKIKVVFYRLLFFSVVIILFQSCLNSDKEGSVNKCNERINLYKLKKDVCNVEFKLDSATSPSLEYLKLIKINDTIFLTFLNTYNNRVYCYNYNTRRLNRKILLPNAKDIKGFEIITWDSIISYQYWNQKVILQNEKGIVLNEMIVPMENNKSGYCAQPSTVAPIIYYKNKLHLLGGIMTDEKANELSHSVAEVDLVSKEYKYKLNFPKIYSDYFFGGMQYNVFLSYALNERDGLFVISFPASHQIVLTKDFVNYKEVCAGSKYISNIPEYTSDKDDKAYEYCSENGYYYSILYDKFNNLYYRLCLLPSMAEKGTENYGAKRDLSIIILNNEFKIVGEQLLKVGKDFSIENISSVVVTPDGLLFQKNNNINNEDIISFFKYKIIKK
jgi:hypothetical protein